MEEFKNYFLTYSDITEEALNGLISLVEETSFKKNEIVIDIGTVPEYYYIIKSGYMISYFENDKGKIHTRDIFSELDYIGSVASFKLGVPCKSTYKCITNCQVYKTKYSDLIKLTNLDKNVAAIYSQAFEMQILINEKKIYNLMALNATERYIKLKEEKPGIENDIPQYHIASYLNITPVQLSRIRKEIYSK